MSSNLLTYEQLTALGRHPGPAEYNLMVAAHNGTTVTGVRAYPYDYLIRFNGSDYEAVDSAHNLVYGGADDAGSVDGATLAPVWQACIDALRVNTIYVGTSARKGPGYIVLQGDLALTGPVDHTYCMRFTTIHVGGTLTVEYSGSAGSCLIDLAGAYNCIFEGFNILVTAAYNPTCIFLLARFYAEGGPYMSPSAGGHLFFNMLIRDFAAPDSNGKHTVFYSYASEVNHYLKCEIYVKCSAFVITTTNIWSISSAFTTIATGIQSSLQTIFDGGTIYNYYYQDAGGLSSKIIFDGGGNHVFANSMFGSWFSYLFEVDPTDYGIWGLWFYGNRVEGKLFKTSAAGAYRVLVGFNVHDNQFDYGDYSDYAACEDPSPGTYWFDADYTNISTRLQWRDNTFITPTDTFTMAFWQLNYSTIDCREYGECEPTIAVSGDVYYSVITLHTSDHWSIGGTIYGKPDITFIEEYGASTHESDFKSIILYSAPDISTGSTKSDIGTDYVTFSTNFITNVDFTDYYPRYMRIWVIAQGNEAGTKGIKVALGYGEINLEAKHEWTGTDIERDYSAWTDISTLIVPGYTGPTEMYFTARGASANEDLTVYRVELQFR